MQKRLSKSLFSTVRGVHANFRDALSLVVIETVSLIPSFSITAGKLTEMLDAR